MAPLRTEAREEGGWSVLELVGQLDVATAPGFRQTLQEAQYGRGRRIVLDLSGLEFIDSFGLGVVVGGLKRARAHGGELVVAAGDGRVRHVFEVTGLDAVVRITDRVADVTSG